MKNLKFITLLLLFASSLIFVQCTSEPIEGPQGIAGIDGVNGANGQNGVNGADGGAICLSCHNNEYKVIQHATNPSSKHAIGAALAGRNNSCLNCHSNEGYLASYKTGDISTTFTSNALATQTKITCTTCHSGGHSSSAVAISGKDNALRTADAYKLVGVGSIGSIIDFKNSSNNCIHCHQIRRAGAGYPAEALSTSPNFGKVGVSGTFGPHYGGAVTLLEGIDANEIPGSLPYAADGSSVHRTGASCTSCHMGKAKDGKGNHSFKPVFDNCKTCHPNATSTDPTKPYDINGGQTKIKNLMKDLAKEIVRLYPANFSLNDGVIEPKDLGMLVMPSSTAQIPDRVAKAVFNYRYLYQDHSYGLHNPKYAEALMRNTIADLKLIATP